MQRYYVDIIEWHTTFTENQPAFRDVTPCDCLLALLDAVRISRAEYRNGCIHLNWISSNKALERLDNEVDYRIEYSCVLGCTHPHVYPTCSNYLRFLFHFDRFLDYVWVLAETKNAGGQSNGWPTYRLGALGVADPFGRLRLSKNFLNKSLISNKFETRYFTIILSQIYS